MHNAPHLTVRISQTKKKTTLVGGLKKEPVGYSFAFSPVAKMMERLGQALAGGAHSHSI